METSPEEMPKEPSAADAFLNSLGNTQASHDRVKMIRATREKLAAEQGITVEELTPEELAQTIHQTPFQSEMALDEIFGDGFVDFMNEPEDQD